MELKYASQEIKGIWVQSQQQCRKWK